MATAKEQLCYESVEPGMEITPLEKRPDYAQLYLYSAVTRNAHRIHYDQAFARSEDHPDVLVHGPLEGAFLAQMLTDWIGGDGFLKKIFYSNRGRAVPGDVLTGKGKVTAKFEQDGQHCVACDIWLENQRGEAIVRGSAVVMLPGRKE